MLHPYKFISLSITFALLACACSKDEDKSKHSHSSTTERHLKIASINDPFSLDPRLVRDLSGASVMRMLYEGLMGNSSNGSIVPAIAESVEISEDLKTYTFTLRPSQWSDGTPLSAQDFIDTWKSVLSPSFPAPNAYQLYVIKGAKAAKEGRLPLESIGLKAPTQLTLVIELEQPAPFFLELTSCHFYFPVHPKWRQQISPANLNELEVIGNGPFKLDHWNQRSEFSVIKNPLYWDAGKVQLDRLTLQILDEQTALQLFKANELDWAGSPISTLPQDAIAGLKQEGILNIAYGAGTHWFRFNTQRPPFLDEQMRRAFGLALDRQAIIDHVTQGNQLSALGILPPIFGVDIKYGYTDHDTDLAKILFQNSLHDLGITKEQLPKITLHYAANDRNHKIAQAIQQQWNTTFDIEVSLESTEFNILNDKMRNGFYQISLGSWYADFLDPINFLDIFTSRENPTNQTFWQNEIYTNLIAASSLETNPKKRLEILGSAEKILIASMPVAPIYHNAFNYLKNPKVEGIYFSPLGFLNFKEASITAAPLENHKD